jgi:hypothetical protein
MRNKKSVLFALLLILAAAASYVAYAQQSNDAKKEAAGCPMADERTKGVNERGDKAMGFDHMKTAHHFRLTVDGGVIAVEANDIKDTESRDQIRRHLRHIAQMFSGGNFDTPMFIHAQNPPGVTLMRRLKDKIGYKFEETERGALVRISTDNKEALEAIHEFLRFQIKDHRTGDTMDVTT